MTASAIVKESHTWATFAVLSAETSLEEKIRKDDGEWTAGQAVRMADIDVTGIDRTVSAATMAKIDGMRTNFGHAGPAFVQGMVEDGKHLKGEAIREAINILARRLAIRGASADTEPDSALIRAAGVFAILMTAGGMAREFGLLPTSADIKGAVLWAWDRYRLSGDAIALDPQAQAIARIQTWVAERWSVSIHSLVTGNETKPNREAVGWFDEDAVYLPDHRLMEASGGALKESEVARALNLAGCIAKRKDNDCNFVRYVPGSASFEPTPFPAITSARGLNSRPRRTSRFMSEAGYEGHPGADRRHLGRGRPQFPVFPGKAGAYREHAKYW